MRRLIFDDYSKNSKSVTVILEACFSGVSQSGALFKKASPIIILPKEAFAFLMVLIWILYS